MTLPPTAGQGAGFGAVVRAIAAAIGAEVFRRAPVRPMPVFLVHLMV